ncbi:MAG TPA: RHS repeat-associated core domain-containing protein [Verrucomicrobiae bacterium]|nr:RHS repeat-associated core domain-containing protein [Verrucomicrobiae bacterium]
MKTPFRGYSYTPGLQRVVGGIALPTGSFITNTYDPLARLSSTFLYNSSGLTLDSESYAYNAANQRTAYTNTSGGPEFYTYDPIGQLVTAGSTLGYTYDSAWNLNWLTNSGSISHFLVDTKNELTNAYGSALSYDANGNLLLATNSQNQYVYDAENRLAQWFWYNNGINCTNGGYRTDFLYDGLGRLCKRLEYSIPLSTTNPPPGSPTQPPQLQNCPWNLNTEVHYIYDGFRVIQERDGNNNPLVSYTRGLDLSGTTLEGAGGIGGLLARSAGYSSGNWTNHAYYHADGEGNITYMEDGNQSLVARYSYDPYGNTLTISGTLASANVYRFSSKECHTNSGMYYFGSRFYDPNLHRWLNRDPAGVLGIPNLYVYAGNNPVNFVDPFGDQEMPYIDPTEVSEGEPGFGGGWSVQFPRTARVLRNGRYEFSDQQDDPFSIDIIPPPPAKAQALANLLNACHVAELDRQRMEDFERASELAGFHSGSIPNAMGAVTYFVYVVPPTPPVITLWNGGSLPPAVYPVSENAPTTSISFRLPGT